MARTVLLLISLILSAMLRVDPSDALFTSATLNPGNNLTTGRGTWFSGNAMGGAICVGTNASLACPYGARPAVGKTIATITLQNKAAPTTYTVTVVDATGPVGISTIVTVAFVSSGSPTAVLAAGASDTIGVVLKLKGNTPAGSYTGLLVMSDTTSGLSVAIPLSLIH